MKAVLNGERIECGKCRSLLAKLTNGIKLHTIAGEPDWNKAFGQRTLEIKCKHKDRGKTCNEINTIEL